MVEKAELRRQLLSLRRQLPVATALAGSDRIARHILACDAYRKARRIMGYLAFGREVSVDAVLCRALAEGKEVYVPYMLTQTEFMPARLHKMSDFVAGRYHIRTVPAPPELAAPSVAELILVPAVACDRQGYRLGLGTGCYDRFLPQAVAAVTMGGTFAALLQYAVPADAHDVRLDFIVTEQGVSRTIL